MKSMYQPHYDMTGFSWTDKRGQTYYVAGEAELRGIYWVVPCNVFEGKNFIKTTNIPYPEVLEKYTKSLEKRR